MKLGSRSLRWIRTLDSSRVRLFGWFPPLALSAISVSALFRSGDSRPLGLALIVLLLAPLLVRRRYPIWVFAVMGTVAVVQYWASDQTPGGDAVVATFYALLVAFYTVVSLRPARVAGAAAVLLEIGIALVVPEWSPESGWFLPFVLLSGLTAAAGVLGLYTRTRAALLTQLRERADRLEGERDQQVELAAAAERARIAREMHDVVAHHLTVMIALADGAAASVSSAPDRAAEVMTTVSATGREALADTRRLLGVLRSDESPDGLSPQPDIGGVEALLEQVRAAGLPATITVTGRHRELSSALQLTIYRLIQEALTNTLKHAGPGTCAYVRLEYTDDGVSVDVRDDGLGSAAYPADGQGPGQAQGQGHGLDGMRERVAAWDGELYAGPGSPRGWVVSARLISADLSATSR